MSLIICDKGDVIAVRGTLRDEAGDAITGASVTARSISPAGAEASLGTATHEGNGVYKVLLEPGAAGAWQVRFDAAAPSKAAAEGIVYVRESRFS